VLAKCRNVIATSAQSRAAIGDLSLKAMLVQVQSELQGIDTIVRYLEAWEPTANLPTMRTAPLPKTIAAGTPLSQQPAKFTIH
jgi:hypothetical protein